MPFVKLDCDIIKSTMWSYDPPTKVVWITLLAEANWDGFFIGTIPGLARVANVSIEETRLAIEKFEAPDPDSTSPEYDGRRIEKMDRGWRILNFIKYRELGSAEKKREADRIRIADKRGASRISKPKKASNSGYVADVAISRKKVAEVAHKDKELDRDQDQDPDRQTAGEQTDTSQIRKAEPEPEPKAGTQPLPGDPVPKAKLHSTIVNWLYEFPKNPKAANSRGKAIEAAEKYIKTEGQLAAFEAAASTFVRLKTNATGDYADRIPKMETFISEFSSYIPFDFDPERPFDWKPTVTPTASSVITLPIEESPVIGKC